uniref:HhH-GPD domain-containing protein n=1 Tax=Oryza meridionalis TaxID=40149 RepID=A0A0E0D618_9ORYZ
MAETVDFASGDAAEWRAALAAYDRRLAALGKPDLVEVDSFYRRDLPDLLRRRDPEPSLAKPELVRLLQWKLSRGKWRPRLMDFVKGLDDAVVESASRKAFAALPDLRKAIPELTVLKGVGPATASAVLAAYAPDVAPFMSDEAMVAALGNAKEYTLKQYLTFAEKLQTKSKELSSGDEVFTPSDVERALWSSAVASKSLKAPPGDELENKSKTHGKRKR